MSISDIINYCIIVIIFASIWSSRTYADIYQIKAHLNTLDKVDMALIPSTSALIAIGSILHYYRSQIFHFLSLSEGIISKISITFWQNLIWGLFLCIISILCVSVGHLIGRLEKFYLQNRITKIRNENDLNILNILKNSKKNNLRNQSNLNYISNLLNLIYEKLTH